jgi:transcriptional regulator with XRE-family HTH domain
MDMVKIGSFLAELRKERGLTKEKLGESLGVTNKTVSRWETGSYLPPVEMLQALSTYYGITINEILSGQRLSEQEYRAHAEENVKSALAESSFTLKEKLEYYKIKWKREHRADWVFAVLLAILLCVVGVMKDNGLQIAGPLWISVFSVVQYNRMMAYVEDRAFDGSGRQ